MSIYGSPIVDPGFLIVNHRGFLFAPQSGTYTFQFGLTDDIALLWVGLVAYSGWNRTNAAMVAVNSVPGATVAVPLIAGTYTPIRVVYGNAPGFASFVFSITAPNGTVLLSSENNPGSTFVFQFSCDGTSAPPFPPFGSET
jgi:GLEYA domain